MPINRGQTRLGPMNGRVIGKHKRSLNQTELFKLSNIILLLILITSIGFTMKVIARGEEGLGPELDYQRRYGARTA